MSRIIRKQEEEVIYLHFLVVSFVSYFLPSCYLSFRLEKNQGKKYLSFVKYFINFFSHKQRQNYYNIEITVRVSQYIYQPYAQLKLISFLISKK